MKKILLISLLSLGLIHLHTSAQILDTAVTKDDDSIRGPVNLSTATYTDYLKKSHNQKITSMVIGGAGAILLTIGFSRTISDLGGIFDPSSPPKKSSSTDVLTIGGLVLLAAAVPISLASRANKKKARLYMKNDSIMITPELQITHIASMGIKISL